ncbi:MAG: hypothetical protein IPH60_16850 [Flavobacteriales bacterium]|nr:hypothetical protein [Flavobacteriales bacterium]
MTITPSVTADLDWAIWQAPSAALPNPVGANCVPAAHPIRCSYASQYNTINVPVASANPGAVTGMGRATFGGAANHLLPPFPQNDNTDGWVPGIMVAPGQVYILFVDDHHLMGDRTPWIGSHPNDPCNEVIDCAAADQLGELGGQAPNLHCICYGPLPRNNTVPTSWWSVLRMAATSR